MTRPAAHSLRSSSGATEKVVIVAVLVWLTLLALGSALISSPFVDQAPGGGPIYATTMYLHGLLIGMVGLLGLVAMDVFGAGHKSRTMHNLVLYGTLGAALFSGVGGIFNHVVEDLPFLWMQILSFFFLDEILLTLAIALFLRAAETHRVAAWAAALAALGGFASAVMGHISGWILEFGDFPKAIVGGYATMAGETWQAFDANLISAHAHLMVIAVIALAVATTCAYFLRENAGSRLVRFGLWWMAIGTVATTLVYLVAGLSQAQPAVLFRQGVSGIPGDDLVTGIGVMLGGLVALVGLGCEHLPEAATRWGAALLSALTLVTVVAYGYYIEMHEGFFHHGLPGAPGSTADAIFGWFHQDFALFLIPGLMLLLVVLQRFAPRGPTRNEAVVALLAGSLITFLGALLYLPAPAQVVGFPFYVASFGLLVVLGGVVLSLLAMTGGGAPAVLAAGGGEES